MTRTLADLELFNIRKIEIDKKIDIEIYLYCSKWLLIVESNISANCFASCVRHSVVFLWLKHWGESSLPAGKYFSTSVDPVCGLEG